MRGVRMNDILKLLKEDKAISIGLLLSSIFCFFLFTDKLLSLIACLLSILFSLILLKKSFELKTTKENKLACSSFLFSFLTNLENNKGAKESYESASKYLVGHLEVKNYDNFIDEGLTLVENEQNQKILNYLCEKEKSNEIHLLNYHTLIEDLDNQNTTIKSSLIKAKKHMHKTQLALLFLLLILALIINLSTVIMNKLNCPIYNILGLISTSLFYPAIIYDYYLKLKRI